MIDLYYWTTPNGHKISIFLEEAGLPYNVYPINISQNDQFISIELVLLAAMDENSKLGKLLLGQGCLLYTSPSPRDRQKSRMPSSA